MRKQIVVLVFWIASLAGGALLAHFAIEWHEGTLHGLGTMPAEWREHHE